MTRFQEEWLLDPNLKDWVVRVTNDETKVYCRWCAIVLRAHRSDLTGHANTQKHTKNAAVAVESGASTGPISVQIVSQDPPQEVKMRGTKKSDPVFFSPSPGSRPQYTKRYRKEWEDIDELKAWLRPYENDSSKAYCKFCNCVLRAHRHDLVLHAKSSRHKRTEFSRQNNINSGQISDGDGDMDGGVSELSELDTKRARLDDSIDQTEIPGCSVGIEEGDEQYSQVSMLSTDEVTPGRPGPDVNVIKVEKSADSFLQNMENSTNLSIQAAPIRRRKLQASKVIHAIQSNEFTGYELLQIVKCAVPKL